MGHNPAVPRNSIVPRLRLSLLLLIALLAGNAAAEAPRTRAIVPVAVAELPREARDTLALIKRGGPYPYRKDGSVFGNHERRLPARPRGHYREYTVPTPGARDRGARRIVAGAGERAEARGSGEYYYTDDHYRSFRRIIE